MACASDVPASNSPGAVCDETSDAPRILVVASEGGGSAVGVATASSSNLTPALDYGNFPRLSQTSGRSFVVSTDFDLLFEFDSRCGRPLQKRSTLVTAGSGSANPQDVAVAHDGTLWVPKYNNPEMTLLAKDGQTASIGLAAYDTDGNPQAAAITIADFGQGEKALVTAQKLDDDSVSRRPSSVLRFDVASRAFEAELPLKARNPFSHFIQDRGLYYLASAGDFYKIDEADAGIEEIDPKAFTSRLLVSERVLGGSVAQLAVLDGCGAAVVADASKKNRTALVTFDARTGAALTTFASPTFGPTEGWNLWAVAWGKNVLYLADGRRNATGYPIRRFERVGTTCALRELPAPFIVSQKPVALVPLNSEMP